MRAVKSILCSRTLVVSEIVAIAVLGALGASLPQAGRAPIEELIRVHQSGPLLSALVDTFALDHVFSSAWFLAVTLLTAASLAVTVFDQLRRLRVTWSWPVTLEQMRDAPLQAEFERAANPVPATEERSPSVETRTRGRIGLMGSPFFHTGLLLIMLAGALRASFGVDALVHLIEGETLSPTAAAWARQWPGVLAGPMRLEAPLTLETVDATQYESGALRDLRLQLSIPGEEGVEKKEMVINQDLRLAGGRLFLGSDFGPAALIEWQKDGAEPLQHAVLLTGRGRGVYAKAAYGRGFTKVFWRAEVDRDGTRPEYLEVRVIDNANGALLFGGPLRAGEAVTLADGQVLKLHGTPFWVRISGSRDPALWLVFLGFAVALAGAAIMFTVVKVDICVAVTPAGNRERVFVALNAQRFAPMYQERFQKLVHEHGGPT